MSALAGRVVVVGGGGSGIGAATVAMLRESGATPVVFDVRSNKDPDPSMAPHLVELAHLVDLADVEATRAAVAAVVADIGVPYAAINCAGIATTSRFLESVPSQWARSLDVNLMTCVHIAHAVLPHMVAAGEGRLVFVSSAAAQMGLSDDALYAAGKAAVEGLTRSLALEFARAGISVNCVAPGPIQTPLFEAQSDRVKEGVARHVPMRRVGRPEEVARVLTFLASPDVGYLSGQIVAVNGALHVGH
jgi:2-hydroxycyclohexanecarboxyl-CoA dehydrogenase